MDKSNVVISERNRPLWQIILAAFCFTSGVIFLFQFFELFEFSFKRSYVESQLGYLKLAFLAIMGGFALSFVTNIWLDLKQRKYKIEYRVGPIRFGKWKTLPDVKYISLFKQVLTDRTYILEVNIWYKRNKHFTIYSSNLEEEALEMALHIADKMNVKLLDATVPNNYKYVNIEKLKEKFKKYHF